MDGLLLHPRDAKHRKIRGGVWGAACRAGGDRAELIISPEPRLNTAGGCRSLPSGGDAGHAMGIAAEPGLVGTSAHAGARR